MDERVETTRTIAASPADLVALLSDPDGHVAIDATGMLQAATGSPATGPGSRFVVHMDREALGDLPEMGEYDVTVVFTRLDAGGVEWTIDGTIQPPIGHTFGYRFEADTGGTGTLVTAYYDWSTARPEWKPVFPVIPEAALQQTLGILDRTVRRGYPRPSA